MAQIAGVKASEWNQEEQQIRMALKALEQQSPERLLDGVRILELANKAYFLYLGQPPAEKAKLLRIVLSNCNIDAASFDPTCRKRFDPIFQRVKNEECSPSCTTCELQDLRSPEPPVSRNSLPDDW